MSLPHASLHEPTRVFSIRPGGLRKHVLVLGMIMGCGANHAIWSYAQEVRREAAEQRLSAAIAADNGHEQAYASYMKRIGKGGPGQ